MEYSDRLLADIDGVDDDDAFGDEYWGEGSSVFDDEENQEETSDLDQFMHSPVEDDYFQDGVHDDTEGSIFWEEDEFDYDGDKTEVSVENNGSPIDMDLPESTKLDPTILDGESLMSGMDDSRSRDANQEMLSAINRELRTNNDGLMDEVMQRDEDYEIMDEVMQQDEADDDSRQSRVDFGGISIALTNQRDISGLRQLIFTLILNRIEQDRQDIEGFTQENVDFALPRLHEPMDFERLTKLWSKFVSAPYLVCDSELSQIFSLREANQASSRRAGTIFYVKTITLGRQELRRIVLKLESICAYTKKLKTWWDIAMEPCETPIHLRYIGMTAVGCVWIRHEVSLQAPGAFRHLMDAISTECPEVLDRIKLYEFTNGHMTQISTVESPEARRVRDFRERALIALFDRKTLLNRQSGGYFNDYSPSPSDKENVKALNIQPLRSGLGRIKERATYMTDQLQEWANDIEKFAQSNKEETGNQKTPLSRARVNAIGFQAVPGHYLGQRILNFAAYSAGSANIRRESPFWEGNSSTAVLLRSVLLAAAKVEGYKPSHMDHDFLSKIGFVDFIPWAYASCLDGAAKFFLRYFDLVNPVVTVGLGVDACRTIRQTLAYKPSDSDRRQFVESIGVPEIIQHGENSQQATLLISCLHPGTDKYSDRPPIIREVLFQTIWISLLASQITIETVHAFPGIERKVLCSTVQQQVEKTLIGSKFLEQLEANKKKLALAFTLKGRLEGVTMDRLEVQERQMVKHNLIDRIKMCEIARDNHLNISRLNQADNLWKAQNPDLHLHISRKHPKQWKAWATKMVSEGGSFFAHSVQGAISDKNNSNRESLIQMIAPWRPWSLEDQRDWFDDHTKLQEAISSMIRYCWSRMNSRTRKALSTKKIFPAQERLHGQPIYIDKCSGAYLELKYDGKNITLWLSLRAQAVAPQDAEDIRTIWFSADGIDIRDKEERSLLAMQAGGVTRTPTPPTVKLYRLLAMYAAVWERTPSNRRVCPNRLLAAQWEQETGLSFVHTLFPTLSQRPHPYGDKIDPYDAGRIEGRECRYLPMRSNHIKHFPFPPEYGDACWLIKKFLDTWHPEPGMVNMGRTSIWGDTPKNIWVPLQEFLFDATYDLYPHILEMRCLAQQEDAKYLETSIKYCRGVSTVYTQRKTDGSRGKVYHLYGEDEYRDYQRLAMSRKAPVSKTWQYRM